MASMIDSLIGEAVQSEGGMRSLHLVMPSCVDELPIEPTAWNPDNDDVRLPVRVGRTVSISLIPRDLEHGGRPMQRPAPESAIDTHGPFRDRLPAMLCAALALASAVALVLLYLDSPFRTHHGFGTAEGGSSRTHRLSRAPAICGSPQESITSLQPTKTRRNSRPGRCWRTLVATTSLLKKNVPREQNRDPE
ncbi:hypothetical protein MRX96_026283 [Rhipicephalus microplus]